MSIPYIIQGKNLSCVINGTNYKINAATHSNYEKIIDAIKAKDWVTVEQLIDFKVSLVNYAKGKLEIRSGECYWEGRHFHNALTKRLMSMFEQGFDIDPMINFVNNLMLNTSKTAVDELYDFLEKNTLPITSDGYFLAYKKVKREVIKDEEGVEKETGRFVDIHSGTMDNSVGVTVSMNRNEVDDNRNNTCSSGLHFCSVSYLKHFGSEKDPIVILKVHPKDVVSIPIDYNNQKGRACEYLILEEYCDPDKKDILAKKVVLDSAIAE